MSSTVQWGIIGVGNIARAFARNLANSTTGRLVAVDSRSLQESKMKMQPSLERVLRDKGILLSLAV